MSVSVNVVCYQVKVSTAGQSLVQRSPTAFSVSEYDSEISTMNRQSKPKEAGWVRD